MRNLREERDHGGTAMRAEGGKCDARASLTAPSPSVCPPTPYPATAWRRRCRGAAAHRYCSAVSRPSCEGKLPLRSLPKRYLREGRRSGIMGEMATSAEGGKCDARASPSRRHPPCPSTPCPATAWRRGCRGVVAHSVLSAVSSPSCEGKLPPRLFQLRYLREGRRSGIMGGTATNAEGGKCDARASPRAATPSVPSHPYPATAWRRGCRGAAAHSPVSAESWPSCEGTLPPRSLP